MILSCTSSTGSRTQVRLKTMAHAKPVILGRGKEADMNIDDPMCSRVHCAIRYWDDIFVIRNMGSSNGTLLNGEPLEVAEITVSTQKGSRNDIRPRRRPDIVLTHPAPNGRLRQRMGRIRII